jgi:hypothetical protein
MRSAPDARPQPLNRWFPLTGYVSMLIRTFTQDGISKAALDQTFHLQMSMSSE